MIDRDAHGPIVVSPRSGWDTWLATSIATHYRGHRDIRLGTTRKIVHFADPWFFYLHPQLEIGRDFSRDFIQAN